MSALRVGLGVRLFTAEDEKCFGPGIAELMTRIEKDGSLRQAAIEMRMAYSKAWQVVRDCERALGYELIGRSVGGRRGGGSRLTARGAALLKAYRTLEESLNQKAGSLAKELFPED